jgi:hypothetical protein
MSSRVVKFEDFEPQHFASTGSMELLGHAPLDSIEWIKWGSVDKLNKYATKYGRQSHERVLRYHGSTWDGLCGAVIVQYTQSGPVVVGSHRLGSIEPHDHIGYGVSFDALIEYFQRPQNPLTLGSGATN